MDPSLCAGKACWEGPPVACGGGADNLTGAAVTLLDLVDLFDAPTVEENPRDKKTRCSGTALLLAFLTPASSLNNT